MVVNDITLFRFGGGCWRVDKASAAPTDAIVSRETCETILAKLHFAVAPVDSVAMALQVMSTLRPEVVVARVSDASALRAQTDVPVVEVTAALSNPDALVEAIRQALRRRTAP